MTRWKGPRQTQWLFSTLVPLLLTAAKTPEQTTLDASKLAQPLSDLRWAEIAKDQLEQEYEILKGDTLWGISKRLFGEGNYWPKVWALNGQSIPNPHWIYPGRRLVFKPGTRSALPLLALADDGTPQTASDVPKIPTTPGRSQEWRSLPAQEWEQVQTALPIQIDPQGIDLRTRYRIPRTTGFDLSAVVQTNALPVLGRLQSSESALRGLTAGDVVFFEAPEDVTLEPGKILTLSQVPQPLEGQDREGLIYNITGQVQVIGLSGEASERLWRGKILQSNDLSLRKDTLLIDLTVRRQTPTPTPAADGVNARLYRVSGLTQHVLGFIDLGSEEGITTGMVFRAYQYNDLSTGTQATGEDVIPLGDCLVVDVSEKFSTCQMVSSREVIPDGAPVKALTSAALGAGLDRTQKIRPTVKELEPETPANELDPLEENSPLSEEEKRNLQQLEQKNEPGPGPEPTPSPDPNAASPSETLIEPEEISEQPPTAEPAPEPTPEPAPEPNNEETPEAPPDF